MKGIALYPGAYKPPTRGHFLVVKSLLNNSFNAVDVDRESGDATSVADKPEVTGVKIFIGTQVRNGITQEISKQIWDIYSKYLKGNLEITASDRNPVADVYSLLKHNPETPFFPVVGYRDASDMADLKRFDDAKKRYPNMTILTITSAGEDATRATDLRKAIIDGNDKEAAKYLPNELSPKDLETVINLLKSTVTIEERMNYSMEQVMLGLLTEEVDFTELETTLDTMFDDLDIDINFTKHFKERVLERGLTEEDILDLMSKIHDKYGDALADLPKDTNRVFTHLTKLVDISSAMGSYDYDGLKDLYLTTAYKRKDRNEPEFRTNASSPKLKVAEVTMGTPVAPIAVLPSEERQRMQNLTAYFQKLAPDDVIVDFNGQSIVITPMLYNKARAGGQPDYTPEQEPIQEYPDTVAAINYVPYIASILEHMVRKGMKVLPLPEIKTREDQENAANVFGRTAYYDPGKKEIVLYVTGRHPKDVLRSFCHEMIHHMQNLEGRLPLITTTNTQEDAALNEIEKEAHYLGSMTMREWEDSVKNEYNDPQDGKAAPYGSGYNPVKENAEGVMTVYRIGEIPYDEASFFVTPDYKTWIKFHPGEEVHKITTKKLYLPLVDKSFSSFEELKSKYESGEFTEDDVAYINPEESGIQHFEQYEIKPEDIIDVEELTLDEGTKYRSIVADVRQAVNIALNTLLSGKKLKGYNVKTKREPSKADEKLAAEYGMSPLGLMLNTEKQVAYIGKFESKSEKGTPTSVEVELKFALSDQVKPGTFYVDGAADSDEGSLEIMLAFNPADGTNMLQTIQPTLTDLIRHETEHLTQSGDQVKPDKWMRKDEARRREIRKNPESWYKYYMLPKEVDANIQGLYTKSKYEKKNFQTVVDAYLDDLVNTDIITVGNKQKIYDLWKARIPQIGGIPNLK